MTFEERYAAARRQAIARDFRRLNEAQQQAALTTEGPLLLLCSLRICISGNGQSGERKTGA